MLPQPAPGPIPEVMRPAPHIRPDGSVVAPIGTLQQQLWKATAPIIRSDAVLSERYKLAFRNTMNRDPEFGRFVRRDR